MLDSLSLVQSTALKNENISYRYTNKTCKARITTYNSGHNVVKTTDNSGHNVVKTTDNSGHSVVKTTDSSGHNVVKITDNMVTML